MRNEIRLFLTALTFFTRIPSPFKFEYRPEMARDCIKYLPFIGLIVAAISLLVYWLCLWIFNTNIAVLLSLITGVFVTGAFHEDGFIDACDGLGGGWEREDVLRIMQDSRVGSFGVISFVVLLLLKYEALMTLPQNIFVFGLLLGHSLSRFAAVSLVQSLPYLRKEKEGKCFAVAQPMKWEGFCAALLFGVLPLFLFELNVVIAVLIVVSLARVLIKYYLNRRLQGYTGDCLGWSQQITEVLIYLSIMVGLRFA